MKNLLLTLVGFLFTANLFPQYISQKADTIFSYYWKNDGWALDTRSFNTYGEGCQSESLTDQYFVSGLWINLDKTLYTYDANSRESVETHQSWDTISSSFENSYRYTYTYNASGNITSILTETWDGSAWQNGTRYTYTYDGSGYLISDFGEIWLGGSWVNNTLGTYTNNSDGTIHIFFGQIRNSETDPWENSARDTYTYNGAGKVLTFLEEQWWQGAWVNNLRLTYTYSGNNLTYVLREDGDGLGGWKNDEQGTRSYNGDGTVSQSISQRWLEGEGIWVNNVRVDYVYTTACALPLTLLNFTGTKNNNSVLLTWKTANEINTSHFAVQRSLDAVNFSDINIVPATPGSITKNYSFTDNVAGIKAPKIYYRLKMVDNDGKFKMSNVVLITLVNQELRFTIKPNPAKNYFIITNNTSAQSDALVNIIDFSGRSVLKQTITLSGENKINISALPKGVYMVIINTGDNITTQKLVVQ
jgi:YD repeat-containing protein